MGLRLPSAGEGALGGGVGEDRAAGADSFVIAAILIAAVAVTGAPAEKPLAAGTLCIDKTPCTATEGRRPRIVAAPESRRFVWTSDDHAVVAVGSIAPDEREVVLDGGVSRPLHIRTLARKELAFELASPQQSWRWTVTNAPPSIRLIHPACDDCVLTVEAEGFRRFAKPLRETVDVVLLALPVLRGRVIDRTNAAPLPGATISVDGSLLAKAGANGMFEARIEGEWPRSIDVAYPGRAPLRVELPRMAADTELPPIALAAGGTLRATIAPPVAQQLTWELRDPKSHALVRQGTIAPSAVQVTVDGIGEGAHSFVIRGDRPLQQVATKIEIRNESVTEIAIAIEPAALDLEVTRGTSPLPGAKLRIGRSDDGWYGEIVVDKDGLAKEELWQRGGLYAIVINGSVTLDIVFSEANADHVTWRMAMPDKRVAGRVLDAATGTPVGDAIVNLDTHRPNDTSMRYTRTDQDGQYSFEAIGTGTHELRVAHGGYTTVEHIPVTVGESDGTYKSADVRLRSEADGRMLVISDERDLPVADALVMLGDGQGLREVARTAIDGTCTIPVTAAGSGVVFVIPRSGSFGFLRVMPQREGETTIPMRVRNATAAIDVDAKDGEGKPLADVLLMARVNGMMLPPEVIDTLRRVQGVSFVTDATGHARLTGMPPGVYELWAITGRDQMAAVQSPAPPPPSASLEVLSGRYGVTIEFAAR
jgi:hypothetical protein